MYICIVEKPIQMALCAKARQSFHTFCSSFLPTKCLSVPSYLPRLDLLLPSCPVSGCPPRGLISPNVKHQPWKRIFLEPGGGGNGENSPTNCVKSRMLGLDSCLLSCILLYSASQLSSFICPPVLPRTT